MVNSGNRGQVGVFQPVPETILKRNEGVLELVGGEGFKFPLYADQFNLVSSRLIQGIIHAIHPDGLFFFDELGGGKDGSLSVVAFEERKSKGVVGKETIVESEGDTVGRWWNATGKAAGQFVESDEAEVLFEMGKEGLKSTNMEMLVLAVF